MAAMLNSCARSRGTGHKACKEDLSVLYHRIPRLFAALGSNESHESFTMIAHDSPSLFEALPGLSG
jgi:hypothetical protein